MYTTRDIMLMIELANHLASRGAGWDCVDALALIICRPEPVRSVHEVGLMLELFGIRHDEPTADEAVQLIMNLDDFAVYSEPSGHVFSSFVDAIWGHPAQSADPTVKVEGYIIAYPRSEE